MLIRQTTNNRRTKWSGFFVLDDGLRGAARPAGCSGWTAVAMTAWVTGY